MHSRSKVSVIITVNRKNPVINERIQSALNQTYENTEFLIVQYGEGQDIDLSDKYSIDKIRFLKNAGSSLAQALYIAIDQMQGDYFSWMPEGSIHYNNKIAIEMEFVKNFDLESDVIIFSNFEVEDLQNKTFKKSFLNDRPIPDNIEYSVLPVLYDFVCGATVLIHKDNLVRAKNILNETSFFIENEIWFRVFRNHKSIFINEALAKMTIFNTQSGEDFLSKATKLSQDLKLRQIQCLTKVEITKLEGSEYIFYQNLLLYCKQKKFYEISQFILSKLSNLDMLANTRTLIIKFKRYIKSLSKGKANRICIFGAGHYGKLLYYALRNRHILIDYFCDNDPNIWGFLIQNIYCLSPEELLLEKENILVIIAISADIGGIRKQLKTLGFPYITTRIEIERELLKIPAWKWPVDFNCMDGIDYENSDVQFLINKFNDAIYDVCVYYENLLLKENNTGLGE